MTKGHTIKKKPGQIFKSIPLSIRFGIAVSIGGLSGIAVGIFAAWTFAPLVFWDITSLLVSTALWLSVRSLSAKETKEHATSTDPGRGVIDIILIGASIISLGALLMLMTQASQLVGIAKISAISLSIMSVISSWTLIHLIYMIRYADLYFREEGTIDFNSTAGATYQDFAYFAFTIGMTYQVSDTSVSSSAIRREIRTHALLSYLFGTAIIATVINTVAGLGK